MYKISFFSIYFDFFRKINNFVNLYVLFTLNSFYMTKILASVYSMTANIKPY